MKFWQHLTHFSQFNPGRLSIVNCKDKIMGQTGKVKASQQAVVSLGLMSPNAEWVEGSNGSRQNRAEEGSNGQKTPQSPCLLGFPLQSPGLPTSRPSHMVDPTRKIQAPFFWCHPPSPQCHLVLSPPLVMPLQT